jgi:hypothetical protein
MGRLPLDDDEKMPPADGTGGSIEQIQQHPLTVGVDEGPGSRPWTVKGATTAPQDQELNPIEKEIARLLAVIIVKKARLAERERRSGESSDLRPEVH